MNLYMKEAFSKPIISPSNPVRDDLALLGLTRLAAGPVEPFHSLHYFEITGTSPHGKIDILDIARHNNTIARWWAHRKLRLTDVEDGSDSESSWGESSHSVETLARRVSPAPSVRNLSLSSGSYINPLKSCLKGPTTTHQNTSLVSPESSLTAERLGRRVAFNEIVVESIIADAPMIITGVQRDVGVTDIKERPGLGDDWVHVPIHSVLGPDLGQENGSILNHSAPSLIFPPIRIAPFTIKAIMPLDPVSLYPPPRQEEIGVTVKFVTPIGLSWLKVEDLLPSSRALRATADAKLARKIDRMYERYERGFMVDAFSVGTGAAGGGYLVDEELGKTMERMSGHAREKKVHLGRSVGGEVQPRVSAAGGKGASIKREPTVRTYIPDGAKITPPKGCENSKVGAGREGAFKGGVGDEGPAKHEASGGMVAKVVGLTKGWIWRSG